ncbi:unnamed protein product [Amaranthus hypochondriacus]
MDKQPFHNTKNDDFSKLQSLKTLPKRPLFSSKYCLPTSIVAILVIVLLTYNSFSIFYFNLDFPMENDKEIEKKLPCIDVNKQLHTHTLFSKTTHHISYKKTTKQNLHIKKLAKLIHKSPSFEPTNKTFAKRVRLFFNENSCRFRVFMTWISSIKSFQEREKFTIESLFKFHPQACLLIVSNSMGSSKGTQVLEPFLKLKFKVMAISPDFKFIFKNTMADDWYNQLEKGHINPGEISIGQNLSNLLRLALLYKYGGVYMDTDFIVVNKLDGLKNVIGAQTIDPITKNWARLNNALMIFDKKHPLLFKFIEEFALTFNGNKWGHNGPYLVSRVVSRVISNNNGTMEDVSEFTILPPIAFYVVDWSRIGNLFKKPVDENHSKWINHKLNHIKEESYVVHLWNRQSRKIQVENGSIISHLMKRSCIFCNSSRETS